MVDTNYGKVHIDVKTETDNFHLYGKPCNLSAFSFVPPDRDLPQERTFYNSPKEPRQKSFVYDLVFSLEYGYNEKLPRCDRRHNKMTGLCRICEEKTKKVPSLSSSWYGHHLDHKLEREDRSNGRIQLVESEFYRRNGVNMESGKNVAK